MKKFLLSSLAFLAPILIVSLSFTMPYLIKLAIGHHAKVEKQGKIKIAENEEAKVQCEN